MKRLLILTGVVALAAASISPALAAKPRASSGNAVFAWGPTTNRSLASIVEQQSPDYFYNGQSSYYCTHYEDGTEHPDTCVHNPTTCVWSEDDELVNGSYGVLKQGTTSFTDCMIADNTQIMPPTSITGTHVLGLSVVAATPDLIVQVTYQPQNVTFTFTPQLVNGSYEYRGCIVGPIPDGDQLQPIAGSNGGWGVQESITTLTTNPTGRQWQKTLGSFYIWADAYGLPNTNLCRPSFAGISAPFELNGAMWQTGL